MTSEATSIDKVLQGLSQGDLISIGAVSIVGRGVTAALQEALPGQTASSAQSAAAADELWSLTVDSEIGWYVILSGPCDIVRDPQTEPCLAVCPVTLVDAGRHAQLRRGGYSPREFPLPAEKLRAATQVPAGEEFWPVADLRYVTTVDKTALIRPDVATLRPLTGPQQGRLARWIGHRFARPAHPDAVEECVLKRVAPLIAKLARQGADLAPGKRTLEQKLVAATDTWLLACTEMSVTFHPVLTEADAKLTGLFNQTDAKLDTNQIAAAAKKLTGQIGAVVTPGSGYQVKVLPVTWDGISASDYLSCAEWYWEDEPDPLTEASD